MYKLFNVLIISCVVILTSCFSSGDKEVDSEGANNRESDSLVLIDVIESNFKGFQIFDSIESPIHKWSGVTLTDNRITKLEFISVPLTKLPETISKLNMLDTLRISVDDFEGLPTSIVEMENLEVLEVKYDIMTELPVGFDSLQLKKLHLEGSRGIFDVSPIFGITELEELYINDLQLTSLPSEIMNLSNLEVLSVKGNNLQALPKDILSLNKLSVLNVSDNKLKEDQMDDAVVSLLNTLIPYWKALQR